MEETIVTPSFVTNPFAGTNLLSAPATSKLFSSFPIEIIPFGALSKVSLIEFYFDQLKFVEL